MVMIISDKPIVFGIDISQAIFALVVTVLADFVTKIRLGSVLYNKINSLARGFVTSFIFSPFLKVEKMAYFWYNIRI